MGKSKKHDKKSKKKHKSKKKEKLKSSKDDSKVKIKPKITEEDDDNDNDFSVPLELMNSKSHAPQTQQEYEHRQSVIRREVDHVTGRTRLIKGDGEVLEEIVTRDRHSEINKAATRGDGIHFEKGAIAAAKNRRNFK